MSLTPAEAAELARLYREREVVRSGQPVMPLDQRQARVREWLRAAFGADADAAATQTSEQ